LNERADVVQFDTLPQADHELVLLRPILEADIASWYAYISTPAVYENTSWNVTSPEQLSQYIWQPQAATPTSVLRLAVALRSTDQLVGTVGFHSVSPENRNVELAYDYAPSVWGKGLATHLALRCLAWAHAIGFNRVQATVLESNSRSKAVLERCGFEHEGLLRGYRMVRGVPGNFHMYAHVALPAAVACNPISGNLT
jgi:ribosomal-protein-alanine N-acetyltransferase